MGGRSSKEETWRQSSNSWTTYVDPHSQSSYGEGSYAYEYDPQSTYSSSQLYYNLPPPTYYDADESFESRRVALDYNSTKLRRKYSRIADNYNSIDEVTEALARAGLESSNLIVGVDFTKSNEWTGKNSFHRQSLHHIGSDLNPYEQAISIIGKTMAEFDDDNLIPCFGFGDASTHDGDVFSFYPDGSFCNGFEDVLSRYREVVPHLRLAGPTSFAPIIEMAVTIVEQSRGQYHVLVIIADGQVTRSVDTEYGKLSPQEQETLDAIVRASKYPLSIILVGVGDGPWDTMKQFDDNIPARAFDNFQFVNFTEITSKNIPPSQKEVAFALAALMEIPSQYKAAIELSLLGYTFNGRRRVPLPPPSTETSKPSHAARFEPSFPPQQGNGTAPPAPSSTYDNQLCPICLSNSKDMAFGCGHQTCCECGKELKSCPICRSLINTRIKLY
ncbi:unnamed protein product [Trifolium pratense]|uniref:Uncharacterized protein n=1 Tax=Trifolium pratense TaxID=57577 RepID=A0ACB0LNM1_TRIPR|nr:unnamed protein product [Trifolium pratense]